MPPSLCGTSHPGFYYQFEATARYVLRMQNCCFASCGISRLRRVWARGRLTHGFANRVTRKRCLFVPDLVRRGLVSLGGVKEKPFMAAHKALHRGSSSHEHCCVFPRPDLSKFLLSGCKRQREGVARGKRRERRGGGARWPYSPGRPPRLTSRCVSLADAGPASWSI